VLHHAAGLLERELLREEVARRALEERLVFGEVEFHRGSCGQVEHALGDDVALDLGRAGVDRAGARPEELARPVDVGPRVRAVAEELAAGAEEVERRLAEALVELAPVDLLDRRLGPGTLPSAKLASVRTPFARMTSFSTTSRASFSRTAPGEPAVLLARVGEELMSRPYLTAYASDIAPRS
jgi:hypothetical protein